MSYPFVPVSSSQPVEWLRKAAGAINYLLGKDAAASSSWIPLVDGAEPPSFLTDGAGQLILVAYD